MLGCVSDEVAAPVVLVEQVAARLRERRERTSRVRAEVRLARRGDRRDSRERERARGNGDGGGGDRGGGGGGETAERVG
jgi:uncharacterized membrane protein YgcG